MGKIKESGQAQQQAGVLWADIIHFFKETFEQLPKLETIERSAENLKSDLEARFNGQYDIEALLRLLKNGFQQTNGNYLFKRGDFFPEAVVKQLEGAGA